MTMFSAQLTPIFNFIDSVLQIEGYQNIKIIRNTMALVGDISIHFPQDEIVKTRARANHIEEALKALLPVRGLPCPRLIR